MNITRKLAILSALLAATLGGTQCAAMATTSAQATTPDAPSISSAIISIADAESEGLIPATDTPNCTWNSDKNLHTCFQINGGGAYVSTMVMTTCLETDRVTMHHMIQSAPYYPGPNVYDYNGPEEWVDPGWCLKTTFTFNGDVSTGNWEGIVWQYYAGAYHNMGTTWEVVS